MVRDLTDGTPWRHITALAVPLLLGNIFQASYNLIDTMIVGRYAGPLALAGVGVASPIFNLINALLMGLSIGSSIVVSQLFGKKRMDELPTAVSTVLITSLLMSIVLTAVGQALAVPLLRAMKTPDEGMADAVAYLRVILFGLVCNVFYNQLTGMLRGLGNTRAPLYILFVSCCINAGLDVLFVCVFKAGAAGAALATVIAEGLSALLTALYIRLAVPQLRLRGSRGFDREMFSTVVRVGFPMGLQQASISLGHVLLQGIVNPFGTALIDGYAAAAKVDMFAVMPIISVSSAMSTFSAQNSGAGQYDRVQRGCRVGCGIIVVICIVLAVLVTPFREFWMGLFVSREDYPEIADEIVRLGAGMLAITPLFYWILGLIHALCNTMAGAGDTLYSMVSMVGMMLLRVLFAWVLINAVGMNENGIWLSFPLSWTVALAVTVIYYRTGRWKKRSITAKA